LKFFKVHTVSDKSRTLITGASGVVSSLLISELKNCYDIVLTDVRHPAEVNPLFDDLQLADLVDSNRDNYRHLLQGVDTVIHNAFVGTGRYEVLA
jgi:nucleoside-diphosphate-sugar epimerase